MAAAAVNALPPADTDDHKERLEGFYGPQAHACEAKEGGVGGGGRTPGAYARREASESGMGSQPAASAARALSGGSTRCRGAVPARPYHSPQDVPAQRISLGLPCDPVLTMPGLSSLGAQTTPSAASSSGAGDPCWPPARRGWLRWTTWWGWTWGEVRVGGGACGWGAVGGATWWGWTWCG